MNHSEAEEASEYVGDLDAVERDDEGLFGVHGDDWDGRKEVGAHLDDLAGDAESDDEGEDVVPDPRELRVGACDAF